MATAAPKVNLIPWDHTSEAHVERLIAQRKACGWGADEVVSSWVPRAEKGLKTMFWVVSLAIALFSPVITHSQLSTLCLESLGDLAMMR